MSRSSSSASDSSDSNSSSSSSSSSSDSEEERRKVKSKINIAIAQNVLALALKKADEKHKRKPENGEPLRKRQRPDTPEMPQPIKVKDETESRRDKDKRRSRSRDNESGKERETRKKRSKERERRRSESPAPRKRSKSPRTERRRSRSKDRSKKYESRRREEERRERRSLSSHGRSSHEGSVSRYWGGKAHKDERSVKTREINYRDKDREFVGNRYYEPSRNSEKSRSESKEKSSKPVSPAKSPEREFIKDPAQIPERQRKVVDLLTSKTGGAYIPPARLRLMQAEITDKSSIAYQRIAWEALKKSIHGFINKVNVDNIGIITRDLLKENIVRGRGLLCRSIIQAQAASPTFTHVYAALVAIINSKFPNIGELLLRRLVIQFKRGFRRNDKPICLSSSRFIAHLVNQRVAHEILALEILTLLVENPTDDSVEVAIAFLKECGQKLTEVTGKGVNAIFEMLKNILHEGQLDKRVQYMIEVVFQVRKDGFKDHAAVIESLELVEEDDQYTHLVMLDEVTDEQNILNVFKFDEQYEANETKYKDLSKELLGSDADDSDSSDGSGSSGSGSDSDDEEEKEVEDKGLIIDNTETNLIALRRTIYLTIHSSLDYEECAHKLMKMDLKPGQEAELCHMFLDCCAEQRTYEKFYGLLAQRFCMINKTYVEPFEQIFRDTYETTHRLDTNRLRNVSKFFAHLLFSDAIGWDVMSCIRLNEDDTTSSSRIFIKILIQELAEYMGLLKLNTRFKDPTLQECFAGLFPRDNPRDTRFSINFFTSIGLGGLTEDLREHLKRAPKVVANPAPPVNVENGSSSSSNSSTTSSSSDSSSSESSSSSSSEDEKRKKKLKEKSKSVQKEDKNRDQNGSRSRNDKENRQIKRKSPDFEEIVARRKAREERHKQMEQMLVENEIGVQDRYYELRKERNRDDPRPRRSRSRSRDDRRRDNQRNRSRRSRSR